MREKQIEEMIEIVKPFVSGFACGDESGSCELTDCRSCKAINLAKAIIEKGYRKQSEGEWIAKEKIIRSITALNYTCSVCGVESRCTPYCPNCGAKMKGGGE